VRKGSNEYETMVRYLLGELDGAERDRLEEQYFQEDSLHEYMLAVEAELIDSYVHGKLTSDQMHRFENRYLTSPEGKKEVQFARSLAVSLGNLPRASSAQRTPWWQPLLTGFVSQSPTFRFAVLMAALLLLLSPLLIMRLYRSRPEGQLAGGVTGKDQQIKSSGKDAVKTPKEPHLPVLALALVPVQRSGETSNTLEIPSGEFRILMQLALQYDEYPSYRVILQTPEGKDLHRADGLKAVRSAPGTRQVWASLPPSFPTPGDYIVQLSGVRADGTAEELDAYAFRITMRISPRK
jgi:hypothetical protein